jgi:hypothetical protein
MDDIFHAKIIGDAEMQALSFILVFIDLLSKIAGVIDIFSFQHKSEKKRFLYSTLHFFFSRNNASDENFYP